MMNDESNHEGANVSVTKIMTRIHDKRYGDMVIWYDMIRYDMMTYGCLKRQQCSHACCCIRLVAHALYDAGNVVT